MKRVFFNWDRPFLPAIAERIVQTGISCARRPGILDLGKYVFILSGSRAIRTLESYVQLEVERAVESGRIERAWTPPVYMKLGAAPERLYTPERPSASRLTSLYCMREAVEELLASATPSTKKLLPDPPKGFSAQLELASTYLKLKNELDSERKTYANVAEYCAKIGQADEVERWKELERLDKIYATILLKHGLSDLNAARLSALKRIGASDDDAYNGEPREYRLVGAVDLNRLQKSVFERLGDRIEAWVFAPEEEEARFDEFGCVIPDAWEDYRLDLSDDHIFQVDSPVEQGEAAGLLVRELSKRYDATGAWRYEPIDPNSLTIGVPDHEVAPFVARYMSDLGYETVLGEGESIKQNRVYQLLSNLAEYLETRSFSSFSELLRRYDVGRYFNANWKDAKFEGLQELLDREEKEEEARIQEQAPTLFDAADDIGAEDEESSDVSGDRALDEIEKREVDQNRHDWIADLDDYYANFMPTRVTGFWFKTDDKDNVKRSRRFVDLRKASYLLNRTLLGECGFWNYASNRDSIRRVDISRDDAETFSKLRLKEEDFIASLGLFEKNKDWDTNQKERPLNEWSQYLSKLLCAIYANLKNAEPETIAQIDGFFRAFNKALYELKAVPTGLANHIKGSEAIRIVLQQMSASRTDPAPQAKPIEMQGWLDLLFDDAPDLILTGFNEGKIPSNMSSDLFLPNETRSKVGLNDGKRVYARDAYLTSALIHSRRNFFIVFERVSLQGDPKTLSRFLFATDHQKIAERVVRFTSEDSPDALATLRERQLNAKGELVAYRAETTQPLDSEVDADIEALRLKTYELQKALEERVGFSAPALDLTARDRKYFESMNVTDFEKFLTSPYAYFLRKAFRLNASNDPTALEFNPGKFGDIIHNVLRAFGSETDREGEPNAIRDSVNEREINAWLQAELVRQSQTFVNEHTSPFVHVQLRQISSRLRSFARWQAKWRALGNRIQWVEKGPKSGYIKLDVGGETIDVVGRIDRIDRSEDGRSWYVFDYKTFDKAESGASKAHELSDPSISALLTSKVNNTTDKKHRVKKSSGPSFQALQVLTKYGIVDSQSSQDAKGSEESPIPVYAWTNLQLPLYRRIFWQILSESADEIFSGLPISTIRDLFQKGHKLTLAYITLPKSSEVRAYGAPWDEKDFQSADSTVSWVVRTMRRLSKGILKPTDLIDPELPDKEQALDKKKFKYVDEFAPITLSYIVDD